MSANNRNLRTAEPKPPSTMSEEQRRRHNDIAAKRRLIRIVNTNFSPADYYVTLTYDDEHLTDDFKWAGMDLENYLRRIKYAAPGVVYVAVMGRGISTSRIHFHLILSGVDREVIESKWTLGSVKRVENLRANNFYDGVDHGADYTGLAEYLFSHWTMEQGKGKRWKQSRTAKQPDKEAPTLIRRKYSPAKPPKAPPGYELVEARGTDYGYLYFKYIKKIPPRDSQQNC